MLMKILLSQGNRSQSAKQLIDHSPQQEHI